MEASAADQGKGCTSRPLAFDKMEGLVREMQDPETGVPVRCQKLFLTSIPSAFMGYDLIEWLMDRLNIEESVEALHIGNLLCQYGYFFPVSDTKNLVVKDDSSLYRFQTPLYWPWQNNKMPDNVEYAIYLLKRTMRNKQRHGLEEYEMEALNSLKSNLKNKWECITLQADEQVKKAKGMKKCDKIVLDSQERAFWRVNRPPPGFLNSLEYVPIPSRSRSSKPKKRSIEDVQREVDFLRRCLDRTRIKMSVALESLMQYCEMFCEWDPMVTPPQPSNPWTSEDPSFWSINSPIVEIPTEKRVRRWAISMEELVSDPTGLQEFTNYLRKEYSHENIRFWLAVNSLRRSSQREIPQRVKDIYSEFLAPGAPCEVNIDGKTMERTQQELKNPSRFTFDPAAEHVYTLLLKKDCYPRFRRSEMYKQLLAAGVQPSAKKRFFNFGPGKKKNQPQALLQQQQSTAASLSQQVQQGSLAGRRRGSDRSLSGSAHELAVSGVRDKDLNRTVSHSHSQSNLSDIPYRGDLPPACHSKVAPSIWSSLDPPGGSSDEGGGQARSTADDVCPWDSGPPRALAPEPTSQVGRTSRKNSSQLDSGGSSSDISIAIAEVSTHDGSCTP
ncbi:regulator of G-protein signaling 7 isoform X2 [Frankliniella occidentalis]|uniref:Regulator of G-protein signaling 7 isoform X2 n=1 Tax=Frankliniella occidentalis TaxID=133901 RepID=A0A9C6TYZ2_FRAOC|nr:regulator of G-protein signaling 7 isoform X2 [Frankliniella occidentalis]